MLKIRYGVFETNSSSTHSLIMCSESEYKLLKDELMLIDWEKLISRHDAIQNLIKEYPNKFSWKAIKDMSQEEVNDILYEYLDYQTLEYYFDEDNCESLETFHETYTTAHGDKVHVFGKYGYDG